MTKSDLPGGIAPVSTDAAHLPGTRPIKPTLILEVTTFYVCLMLLIASGRLGSADAGSQLDAALYWAKTGEMGAGEQFGIEPLSWIHSPNQRYYQCQDLGAVLLMWPSALLAVQTVGPDYQPIKDIPPLVARVLGAVSYSLLAAVGATFMFLLLSLFLKERTAFWLSLLFVFGTIYAAYAKSAWDVLGGCVGTIVFLYAGARTMRSNHAPAAHLVVTSLVYAAACTFRYSLMPFLGVTYALILFLSPSRELRAPRNLLIGLAVAVICLIPVFSYNYVRTGSPLTPGNLYPPFDVKNGLNGNTAVGTAGLLIFPNRGLFLFCPILIVLVTLPFLWRQIDPDARRLLVASAVGGVGYTLMVGTLSIWDTPGWGARLLLPALPIYFFAAAIPISLLWKRHWRWLALLAALSVGINSVTILVNWQLATGTNEGYVGTIPFPVQQVSVWKALGEGLAGRDLSANVTNGRKEPGREKAHDFPDFLLVRIAEQSRSGLIAAIVLGFVGVTVVGLLFSRLMRQLRSDTALV